MIEFWYEFASTYSYPAAMRVEKMANRPFASRHLAEALREGAARFGWERRVAKPASVRDGLRSTVATAA